MLRDKFHLINCIVTYCNVEINILFALNSVEKSVIIYAWSVEIIIFFDKIYNISKGETGNQASREGW